MEEGSLRCDANVSIRPKGQKEFGTKVEVKNMNSFNGVKKAIEYEVARQTELIGSGGKVVQETRLFDSALNKTFSMRSKEEANDYRYFPEPDLPPLVVEKAEIEKIMKALPELPRARKLRFIKDYQITLQDAETLTDDRALSDYFEETVKNTKAGPKKAANWVQSETSAHINAMKITPAEFGKILPAKATGELLDFIEDGVISGKMAKEVYAEMVNTKKSAKDIIESKGLKQISDTGELETSIDKIIAENASEVEKYKAGNTKLLAFFVGEVMKATKGKANPKAVNEILRKKLS
jgi:aspartyl-tRNA(Asn)/glutamyl-tRNA(Gln) amidotransferase subunit B